MDRPRSLRLDDLSDRELLWAWERAAQKHGGGATVHEVADAMDLNGNSAQSIAIRFGWLRRMGVMERDQGGFWLPTPTGEQMMEGELKRAQERTLSGLSEAQVLSETISLTRRLANANNNVAASLVARQMRHGLAQHRRRTR